MPLQPRLPNDIGCFTVYMGWQWRFLHTPPCWRYTILVTSVLRHKRTYARKLLRELYTVRNARSANNCSVSVCINCTCKMAACHDNDANDVTTPHVDIISDPGSGGRLSSRKQLVATPVCGRQRGADDGELHGAAGGLSVTRVPLGGLIQKHFQTSIRFLVQVFIASWLLTFQFILLATQTYENASVTMPT